MNQTDAARLLRLISSAYPRFFRDTSQEQAQEMALVWANLLPDKELSEMTVAARVFIRSDTSGFPPTIGQLMALLPPDKDELGENEAWALARGAISRSRYNAQEEFEKLPKMVQKCLGGHELLTDYAEMDVGQLETVVASGFKRNYRDEAAKAREKRKLPPRLQGLYGAGESTDELPEPKGAEKNSFENSVPMPKELKEKLSHLLREKENADE